MKNKTLEILAPVGSHEMLLAAVRSGADAVYLGVGLFSARRAAKQVEPHELAEAIAFCHLRGVSVYGALNTLLFDGELADVAKAIGHAAEAGLDALIVQDLAAAALVKKICPTLPLHASTQMSCNTVNGAQFLLDQGFSRIVLGRELSAREMKEIITAVPIETEVFVHGAHCMSVSGQCLMSSLIGGRSGNRGVCAQPCRLPFYAQNPADHALSLKDLSLVDQLPALAAMGVTSAKIEGRMKRPEYVASAVTACLSARDKKDSFAGDYHQLKQVFSRSGFTAGFYENKFGREMFGTRRKSDVVAASAVLPAIAAGYRREKPAIALTMFYEQTAGQPISLTVMDGENHMATAEGIIPLVAENQPTDSIRVETALQKLGNTPYYIEDGGLHLMITEGLMVPSSAINDLRRRCLEQLGLVRMADFAKPTLPFSLPNFSKSPKAPVAKAQSLRARFRFGADLPLWLFDAFSFVSLPLSVAIAQHKTLAPFRHKMIVEPPRVDFGQAQKTADGVKQAAALGYTHLAVQNIGDLEYVKQYGFTPHGTFALNLTNSLALAAFADFGLADTEVSLEMDLPRGDRLARPLPLGLVAYGFLPVMATRNCPNKAVSSCKNCTGIAQMTDRKGNRFSLTCLPDQPATEIFNCHLLFLADQKESLARFDFLTLSFLNETEEEIHQIVKAYQSGQGKPPEPFTRGLLHRPIL